MNPQRKAGSAATGNEAQQRHSTAGAGASGAAVRGRPPEPADPQFLAPFCFECLEMAAEVGATLDETSGSQTPQPEFFLVSCGRMLCARCCAQEGMTATNCGINCRHHQQRPERCLAINSRMPAAMLSLFRLDYEQQLVTLDRRWQFVERMQQHLSNAAFSPASSSTVSTASSAMAASTQAPVRSGNRNRLLTAQLVGQEELKLGAERAEEMQLRAGRHQDLQKLRSETAQATEKMAHYVRMYEAQQEARRQRATGGGGGGGIARRTQQAMSTSSGGRGGGGAGSATTSGGGLVVRGAAAGSGTKRAQLSSTVSTISYKTPATHSSASTSISTIPRPPPPPTGASKMRPQFTGDSGVSSARSHLAGAAIAGAASARSKTSTPLWEQQQQQQQTPSSAGYGQFRGGFQTAMDGGRQPLKSILKSSATGSGGGASSRSGGSTSAADRTGLTVTSAASSVNSSAGRFTRVEVVPRQRIVEGERQRIVEGERQLRRAGEDGGRPAHAEAERQQLKQKQQQQQQQVYLNRRNLQPTAINSAGHERSRNTPHPRLNPKTFQ